MANLYQMANASLQVAEIDRRAIGEELFKATVRHAPYFIGICDDQWHPVFINSAGRRMVGLGGTRMFQPWRLPIFSKNVTGR